MRVPSRRLFRGQFANSLRSLSTAPRSLRRGAGYRSSWHVLVPVVVIAAGVLFATSAETAKGTDLRSGRRLQLTQLIAQRNDDVRDSERQAATLRRQIDESTRQKSATDDRVTAAQAASDRLGAPAGLSAVRGPALTIRLDDAPTRSDGQLPPGATVNDVVVHQQDVQAVANALWAGGAEAMTIMGQRVISTGAVRCVGNTLLLYGRTYSPPFVITAIGPSGRLRSALDASPGVKAFREAARDYGLRYRIGNSGQVTMPGYDGQVSLPYSGNETVSTAGPESAGTGTANTKGPG